MKKYLLLICLPVSLSAQELKPELAFDVLAEIPNSRDVTLSSDGTEAYFTLQSPMEEISVIAYCKKIKSKWSEPEMVCFSGKFRDLEPFLSPDGKRLYFASNRPLNETDTIKDFDIWYVERKSSKEEWSQPVNLGNKVNSEQDEFYPSVSNNQNIYFTSNREAKERKDDIFFSEWTKEGYSVPVSMSDSINSVGYEFNAFISPDESFLIFTGYNRAGGMGSGDLYISFKKEGEWGKAINMGADFNTASLEFCPFYDGKNHQFYFTSRRSEIKKEHDFKSLSDFQMEISKPQNGWSRIYKTDLKGKSIETYFKTK